MSKALFLAVPLFLFIFAGCLQASNMSNEALDQAAVVTALSAREVPHLPDYAHVSQRTKAGYVAALEIPETFSKVPCYCSCGAVGHRSLRDCFLDGEGGFEEHASFCDICVSEALDVYTWQKQGVPLSEIRQRIDEKYQRFGEPTPTEDVTL